MDEVAKFYDIDAWTEYVPRFGTSKYHKPRKEDPAKRGRVSTELTDLIAPFSDQAFDLGKLGYDDVRADYRRLQDPWRATRRGLMGLGGMIATITGMGGFVGVFGGNLPAYVVPIATAAFVGGLWLFAYRAHNQPLPKGSRGEFDEYRKLYESADRADAFVERVYRQKLIDKVLEQRE